MNDDDDFLSRWSRRKRAATEEPLPDPEPVPPDLPEEDVKDEEALLAQLNLPLPESMKPGDDFSAFMANGVPQFLRKRALRVLWRSNPVLANLDGLNDYDEDFTSPELTQKVLATAYQVGRGIVSQVLEDAPEEPDRNSEPHPEDEAPEIEQVAEISTENHEPLDTFAHNEIVEPQVKPRRMRFNAKTD